ncbi:MAG TPA: TetR family transcriptional regulator [Clostridia bacterium]|nr:TetR family transcriptional regulator [Clostridia bacterium]
MPRVSAAHEQEVRDRIVAAALRVFSERGYRGATIQDVVRDSGLSVGAIYTYFRSKDELFLECCDLMTGGGLDTLGTLLAGKETTAERLATAAVFYIDSIDEAPEGGPGLVTLVQAWAGAETEPRLRDMLVRRRERLVGAGQLLLREGVARGELPAWIDVDATTRAYIAMLDGMLLQRIEAGESFRPAELERQALAVLDLILAAARGTGQQREPVAR